MPQTYQEKEAATFPRIHEFQSDWKYEVDNGDTYLGFREWLEHKIEDQQNDIEHMQQIVDHWVPGKQMV